MKITRLLHAKRRLKMTQEQRAQNLSKLSGLTYQEVLQKLKNPCHENFQWENDLIINSAKKAGDNLINLLQQQALEKVKREVK